MKEVEGIPGPTERRRYPRLELSQALAYQWGTARGTLRTVDVSLGGIKVQPPSPIPIGERMNLILLLEYEAIKPVGKIVWSNPALDGKYNTGISFETVSHDSLKRLERFLSGIPLRDKLAKRNRNLYQEGLCGVESKSFGTDRLRDKFLSWLHRSHPLDYDRYVNRPEIRENDIRDFLNSKGVYQVDIHYLLKSLRAG